MKNWSVRAGQTVGGLPGQLVQGEEEQVGGEELGKSLGDLGTVWKVWRMQHIRCGNGRVGYFVLIFMLSFRTY